MWGWGFSQGGEGVAAAAAASERYRQIDRWRKRCLLCSVIVIFSGTTPRQMSPPYKL